MKVSVVIPNWNGSDLLKKHLPKVISRIGREAEILVIDDGSTDDSREIVRQFKLVRIIEKDHHEGFASTVNVGVQHAHGEIVVLLNTDVEPESNFLRPILVHFDNPKVFAVGCHELEKNQGGVSGGKNHLWFDRGLFIHSRAENFETGETA